jgi:serine/threonine protein kinase
MTQQPENSTMKLHSMQPRFDLEGEPKFLFTHVILHDDNDYYSAQVPKRPIRHEDISKICSHPSLRKIPLEHIWPKMENELTICADPEIPGVYIKRPRLTGYNGSACLSLWLLQEARICELVVKSPHQNVAQYLGCVVENDRITGLCFEKYEETLEDRLLDGRSVNIEDCLLQISAGLDHLHSLDIVHNDMRLDNVMFKTRDDDVPVIIDFDSCAIRGFPLPDKRRLLPDGVCTAEFENDDYGLDMLHKELELVSEGPDQGLLDE